MTTADRDEHTSSELFAGEYRLEAPLPALPGELFVPDCLWRAEHPFTRQQVLVALLHPERLRVESEPPVKASENEASASETAPREPTSRRLATWDRTLRLSHVDHHAFPELLESSSPAGGGISSAPTATSAFFAWQLEPGPTLRERTSPTSRLEPLGALEAVRVMQHLAEGIEALHGREEIHGTLCPANVLLTPLGARLLAPGFGTFNLRETSRTGSGLRYRAPEQLRGGSGSIGPAADVYTLGVMLHELLFPAAAHDEQHCAVGLLEGQEVATHLRTLPEEVAQILQSCLVADPSRRTRADEVAQLAHLAVRQLSKSQRGAIARSSSTAAGPPEIAASSPTVQPASEPTGQEWFREQRRRFGTEQDDTPATFLWVIPAMMLALLLAFFLLLLALR